MSNGQVPPIFPPKTLNVPKHEIEIYYLSCLLPSPLTESGKIKAKTFCRETKSYASYADATEKAQIHGKKNIVIFEVNTEQLLILRNRMKYFPVKAGRTMKRI